MAWRQIVHRPGRRLIVLDLPQRVTSIRLLLETLDDPYPFPRPALQPDSGPSASRYVPCETCRQRGWVRARRGEKLCLVCDGRGWCRRHGRVRPWDAYTELPVEEAAELPTEPVYASQEAVQRLLRDREEERSGRYWQLTHSWERRKQMYERYGSYREVRAGLDRLHDAQPRRALLLRTIYVEHQARSLTSPDRLDLDLGVVQLAIWIPRPRVPRFIVERTQRERNDEISALAALGLAPAEIAARLEIRVDAVRRALRRRQQRNGAKQGDSPLLIAVT